MADSIKSVDVPSVHGMVALNPDGTAIGTPVGGATSDNQTNGSQKTQIVDAGGDAVTVTGGKLDVNASIDTTGLATSAKQDDIITAIGAIPGGGGTQYTEGDTDASITGTAAMVEGAANALAVMTQPLTDTQLRATDVKITLDGESVPVTSAGITTIAGAVSGTEMQVDVLTMPTVAVTQSGTWDEVGINDSGNSITIDVNGTAVSSTNPLLIGAMAIQDTGNSTTATLGSGGNFTGTAFDLNSYSSWSINIFSNKASSSNGLVVQWSDDGTNWDFSDAITYVASVGNMITFGRKARYVRLNYTNTNSAQTVFRVTAYAQPLSVRHTRKFVGSALSDGETGQVVIAGIQGHTTAGGGAWVDVKVSPSGSLSADVSGSTLGANSGVDIGDVTINNASGASAVNIQDGGNTITVDGTVAVTNSDITSIKTAVEIIDNAVSGNEMQVDVVGALPAGTNTIGAVKSVPSDIDSNGSNANHADKYYTNAGAVTDGIIWSPAAGKRWHVLNLTINVSAACTVTIEDDLAAGDNPRLKFEFAANSGITIPYNKEHPFSSGEDAADLLITTTAGNVYVQAVGYEI